MNLRLTSILSFALVSAVFAAACGGAQPDAAMPSPAASSAAPMASAPPPPPADTTPPPPATTAAAVTPPPPAKPTKWKDATGMDQQVMYMKDNVVGPMAKVFQDHDAKHYADASCKTCHGPKNLPPKEFLPKLTLKNGKFSGKPEVIKFMMEKVVPAMATAMGDKPYDPATKEGFGCGGCHAIDMKK